MHVSKVQSFISVKGRGTYNNRRALKG